MKYSTVDWINVLIFSSSVLSSSTESSSTLADSPSSSSSSTSSSSYPSSSSSAIPEPRDLARILFNIVYSSLSIPCCRNSSSKRNTSSFLCSCFSCHVNSVYNSWKRFRNPFKVAGKKFTFGCISVTSMVSSLVDSSSKSSVSLNPIISPLVLGGVDFAASSSGCSFPWNTAATTSGEGFGRTFSGDSNGNTSATIISGGGLGTFFCSTGAFCGFAWDMVGDGDFSAGLSLIISSRIALSFGFLVRSVKSH